MKNMIYKNISILFMIFLSISLVVSCSKGNFSGTSDENHKKIEEEPDIDPETGEGIYDTNKDGELSKDEYDSILDQLGPVSLTVKRGEGDCLDGKCDVTVTFSLYSIDGTKVSKEVKEKSKTVVTFNKNGSTGDSSHLCPLMNKNVVLNMSINYGEEVIESSNRSILVGGREDKKTIWVGVADKDDGYNFHNIDTIVTAVKCPEVKKLKIKDLCEDTTLDSEQFRVCWTVPPAGYTCPSSSRLGYNTYWDSEYPVKCRGE